MFEHLSLSAAEPRPLLIPYPAEFLKWNNTSSIFGNDVHFLGGNQYVSQQNRAWSDTMDVQAGQALYWWQKTNH